MNKLVSNPAVRFLLIGLSAYLLWLLLYYYVIKTYTNWDYYLNYTIVSISHHLFDLLGTPTTIEIESDHVILAIDGSGRRGVMVGDECNGFKLFSIFAIFILAFPGDKRSKWWFIPAGMVIIHLANIFRVMALLVVDNSFPTFLDFNHLYTFTVLVYAIIFLLWLWWVKKYSHARKS